jgi:RND family efflux transporter MFP subunit
MVRITFMPLAGLGVFLGSCLGLVGCSQTPEGASGKQPPTVTVSYPLQREVTDYQDYTGRTAAVDSVLLQTQVTGYLEKINFKEGAEVEQGAVLYELDPRLYKAVHDATKGQVVQNEANLKLAEQNNTRAVALSAQKTPAIAQAEVDQNASQLQQAVGTLEQSRANLDQARLNLEWCKVRSPIAGLASQTLVTRGNLVVANQTTLTSIVSQDPMWAYFNVDEPTALQVRELIRQGKFGPSHDVANFQVRLQLANEKDFPHQATLDFVNNQLDQATATLLIRAVFPNPRAAIGPRVFAPNMFVRVRVPTSPLYQALLVNAEAIGTDQDLKYLYVVDEGNKVVRRTVKLGSLHDGLQAVVDGLQPAERVIVSGLQRVRPGVTVDPKVVPMPTSTGAERATTVPAVLKAPAPSPKK